MITNWTPDLAKLWTERAIALTVCLQTVELLQCRRAYADAGIWRWRLLRGEHDALPAPLRWLFSVCLPYRPFLALLLVNLLAAALLALGLSAAAAFLLFTQIAVCVRFRGTFNGGSDSLTVLILLALSVAWLFAGKSPLVSKACLAYIAVQVTLSYFVAGVAKLKESAWRDGAALRAFLTSQRYGAPDFARRLFDDERRCRWLSWGILCFECGFPLAWLDRRLCLGLIAAGLVFHVANSLLFGLNRFLFAWSAAYPALLFSSQLLTEPRLAYANSSDGSGDATPCDSPAPSDDAQARARLLRELGARQRPSPKVIEHVDASDEAEEALAVADDRDQPSVQ